MESLQTGAPRLQRAAIQAIFSVVTTSISSNGEVRIPRELRKRKRFQAGDDFEVLEDEDDPSIIILRKVEPSANAGLVDHLLACPPNSFRTSCCDGPPPVSGSTPVFSSTCASMT